VKDFLNVLSIGVPLGLIVWGILEMIFFASFVRDRKRHDEAMKFINDRFEEALAEAEDFIRREERRGAAIDVEARIIPERGILK
jgi:hypothetical protein